MMDDGWWRGGGGAFISSPPQPRLNDDLGAPWLLLAVFWFAVGTGPMWLMIELDWKVERGKFACVSS
jgi:hypothetical protein